jgi:hypothetical protein
MVNASNATDYAVRLRLPWPPAYDEQIIARAGRRVQRQRLLWFPSGGRAQTGAFRKRDLHAQKRAAVSGGF